VGRGGFPKIEACATMGPKRTCQALSVSPPESKYNVFGRGGFRDYGLDAKLSSEVSSMADSSSLRAALCVFSIALTAGCGSMSPAPLQSATGEMPLRYLISVTNSLQDSLVFTLAPGKGAKLNGPSSFELKPSANKTVGISVEAFLPRDIVSVDAVGTNRSQWLRDTMSIVGSYVSLRMRGLGGMDDRTTILRNQDNTEVTLAIDAKPARSVSQAAPRGPSTRAAPSSYSLTLENDINNEPLKVSITPSKDVLHGPSSFVLGPDSSRTEEVKMGSLFDIIRGASRDAQAKLRLIQEPRNGGDIADMFEMQMLMNRLSQWSELVTLTSADASAAVARLLPGSR
jgi:hypothetical protein